MTYFSKIVKLTTTLRIHTFLNECKNVSIDDGAGEDKSH
jgi:hypothetical protein